MPTYERCSALKRGGSKESRIISGAKGFGKKKKTYRPSMASLLYNFFFNIMHKYSYILFLKHPMHRKLKNISIKKK